MQIFTHFKEPRLD